MKGPAKADIASLMQLNEAEIIFEEVKRCATLDSAKAARYREENKGEDSLLSLLCYRQNEELLN